MENVKDWNISRQLWWGHRIPAYYLPEGGFVVAETEEEALLLAREKTANPALQLAGLRQDEDCLDTWFSSWLWPISVFDGVNDPDNADIRYYYPTNDLVTAPEIIFFWVARMIISGYEYRREACFHNVYFTGIVRDKLGRKMSKSLGNSPDPIELMNQYGADGVRMGMLLTSPAGNDLPFDEALCEQGRNFNNKIWNAFRLVKGWEDEGKVNASLAQPPASAAAIKWFQAQLDKTIAEMDDLYDKYRLNEAIMAAYKLFWDEFSAWYLEIIKPGYEQAIDGATYRATLGFFDSLLRLLHPFMPFITEELWQALEMRKEGESIMIAAMPQAAPVDETWLEAFATGKEIVGGIRTIRKEKNIPYKEPLELFVTGAHDERLNPVIEKMGNIGRLHSGASASGLTASFLVRTTEYAIPLGSMINVEEELAKLNEDLVYQQGFLGSILKKLDNQNFVSKAPASVIENERKKQADAESKIKSLEEAINALRNN
jgi:valyl-tRNA synthetase